MLPNKSQAGSNLTSFDVLKTRLFDLSYKKITASEENSRLLDDTVLISKPVMEPSRRIKPEIIHLVREERLRHLVEGAEFPAFPKAGRCATNSFTVVFLPITRCCILATVLVAHNLPQLNPSIRKFKSQKCSWKLAQTVLMPQPAEGSTLDTSMQAI